MKIFGIEHKESGVITVDADRYELRDGFFNFYEEDNKLIRSYSSETVSHVVQQKQYSEEESINYIKNRTNRYQVKSFVSNFTLI